MAELVADYVLRRLKEWGVHRIYGYPGDGINAFLGALDRADGDPEFIQARHEEMAAFMACGHAKFTRRGRRVHGDLRPRRDPPAERPLRREARPRAGRRDRRPAEAHVARRASTSRRSTCRCCSRTCSEYVQYWHGARAGAAPHRPRRSGIALDRKGVATLIFPDDVQEEKAVPSPPRDARRGLLERRLLAAAGRAAGRRPAPRGDAARTRARRSRCSSGRARSARPTRSSSAPTSSAPASRRRCSAAACCPTTCRSSRARSACSARARATS